MDSAQRERLWELLLEAVKAKTLAQWEAIFDENTDLFAELFRSGPGLLDPPQMIHDQHTLELTHPGLGTIREPNVLVKMSVSPGWGRSAVPDLDQHGDELRHREPGRADHCGRC